MSNYDGKYSTCDLQLHTRCNIRIFEMHRKIMKMHKTTNSVPPFERVSIVLITDAGNKDNKLLSIDKALT